MSEKVKITQVVNPSQFFFYSLNDSTLARVIKQEEQDLQKVLGCLHETRSSFQPKVGEICAFYHEKTRKWIKVKIEGINESDAILWTVDYGVSLITNNLRSLACIPEKYQQDHGFIRVGCLSLMPSKTDFDFVTGETVSRTLPEWPLKAIEIFTNFIQHSNELLFTSEEIHENIHFGDIEATSLNGGKCSLRKALLDRRMATPLAKKSHSSLERPSLLLAKRWNVIDEANLELKMPEITELASIPVSNFEKILAALSVKQPRKVPQPSNLASNVVDAKPEKCQDLSIEQTLKNDQPKEDDANESNRVRARKQPAQPRGQLNLQQVIQMQNPVVSPNDVIRLFVNGKYLKAPLQTLKEAPFPKDVHKNLDEMNFRTIFRTQAHGWPHILEGRSIFVINSEKSGKTFTYLPALLSNILFEEENVEQAQAQGPVGIIVVRSSRDVENIFKYCRKMVPREKMEIIKAFGKWNCENKKVSLLNGCDLLITTPPCFSRLAQGDVLRMFDKKRIKFLVLDDLDDMNSSFEQEMKDIIKTCTKGSKHPELNPQLIVTSTGWMEYLRSYMALTCDPVMIIGSFVEAALFAKCQFSICKKSYDDKMNTLLKQLKTKEYVSVKTLIVLTDQAELESLSNFLRDRAFGFHAVKEFDYSDDTSKTIHSWIVEKVGEMSILLMTDKALSSLAINCVQNLIHFSLPDTMTMFSQRFTSMSRCFQQVVDGKAKIPLKTFIMLDEDNGVEIPRLVDFLKTRRVLSEVPEDVNNLVLHLVEERELIKRDPLYENIMPTCPNIYQYGTCPNMSGCKNRHVFTDSDRPTNIPCDGLVKFEMVEIKSPAHFYVKIKAYQLANENKWISCEDKNKKIEESLESLQGLMQETGIIHVGVKTGDLCAVFAPKLVKWCRCKVLEKQFTKKTPFKAIVHLFDYGEKMVVKATDLMALPEHLKTVDPLLTELRIVNLVPFDLDSQFDHETTSEVEKHFTKKVKAGEYMLLRVEFAVQNIVFAKTFEIRSHIEDLNVDITKYSLKSSLLKENLCLNDPTVADKIKMLMKRANIYVPPTVVKSHEDAPTNPEKEVAELKPQPRWKHLTVGSDYQVLMREFLSPNLFYTHLDDSNNKVLPKLMQMIAQCTSRVPLAAIKKDEFCLIALPQQKSRRGVIAKVKHASVKVFLLDEGESISCNKTDVYELPASVINIVPFQSIQCRLIGVKPLFGHSEWSAKSSSQFLNFIAEMCNDQPIKLRVVGRNEKGYDVSLFHPLSGESLHKIAIQMKLADSTEIVDLEMLDNRSVTSEEFDSIHDASTVEMVQNDARINLMKLLNTDETDAIETGDLFNLLGLDLPKTARLLPHTDYVPNIAAEKCKADEIFVKAPTERPRNPSSCDDNNVTSQSFDLPSRLSYIHKPPKIEWRQDESMVVLNILATDSLDYSLQATDASVKIYIKYEGKAYEYTVVQLYGCIESDLTSHEKSGGKVIVRLVKSLIMNWPRLTKINEPNRFITVCHDPLPSYLTEVNEPVRNARPGGDSDSETDWGELSSDAEN